MVLIVTKTKFQIFQRVLEALKMIWKTSTIKFPTQKLQSQNILEKTFILQLNIQVPISKKRTLKIRTHMATKKVQKIRTLWLKWKNILVLPIFTTIPPTIANSRLIHKKNQIQQPSPPFVSQTHRKMSQMWKVLTMPATRK